MKTPCHEETGAADKRRRTLLTRRLSRIEGQVRGVNRMVAEERYCVDILTQLAAIHQGLRAVGRSLVENHMHTCVALAMRSKSTTEAERVSREMAELLDRFTR